MSAIKSQFGGLHTIDSSHNLDYNLKLFHYLPFYIAKKLQVNEEVCHVQLSFSPEIKTGIQRLVLLPDLSNKIIAITIMH